MDLTLERLKMEARQLAEQTPELRHSAALDIVASRYGYASYQACRAAIRGTRNVETTLPEWVAKLGLPIPEGSVRLSSGRLDCRAC